MDFARIRGLAVCYTIRRINPERPWIVFANSLGTDHRIWEGVTARLAGRYNLLTYDKRGHGLSDTPPGPYNIGDHAGDLIGLMTHLDIETAAIVGLSVGGMIAQSMAKDHADRVKALVLSDTGHKIGDTETWNARIAAVEKDGLESIADSVMERWFTDAFRAPENDQLAGYRNMLARTPAAGYVATIAGIRDADFTEFVGSIGVPTLGIVGDADKATPPELMADLVERIPNARLETIEGSGHIPCVEQPEVMARLISDFLKEIDYV